MRCTILLQFILQYDRHLQEKVAREALKKTADANEDKRLSVSEHRNERKIDTANITCLPHVLA